MASLIVLVIEFLAKNGPILLLLPFADRQKFLSGRRRSASQQLQNLTDRMESVRSQSKNSITRMTTRTINRAMAPSQHRAMG
jgi:hypothetical protein